jgi:formylglycine-generating enzyme required for sulfatase activity
VAAAAALASLGALAAGGAWLATRENDATRTGALASAGGQQPPKRREPASETERKEGRTKTRDSGKGTGKNGGGSPTQKPGPAQPEPAKPEPAPVKPGSPQPGPAKPDPAKPGPAKPDPAKPDPVPVKPDPPRPEPAKPQPDPPKPEPPKPAPKPVIPPAPEPVASLRLLPLAKREVRVLEGSPGTLDVKVRRENVKGPVTLRLTGLPAGVRASPDQIPAGSDEVRLYLTADALAAPAARDITLTATIRLTATGAGLSEGVRFRLEVNQVANTIGMALVRVPAGEFRMGSPDNDDDAFAKKNNKDEKPQHAVRVSAFYLSRYEVTRRQYRQFAEKMPYQPAAKRSGGSGYTDKTRYVDTGTELTWREPGFEQTDDHPVVCVSWNEAVEFCNWLSKKEKLQPCYTRVAGGRDWKCEFAANGYRLPTEAEWEYACRAGTTTRYSNGDDFRQLPKVGKVSVKPEEQQSTAPVGSYQPNAFGLYDMHGNAREWCWDRYGKYDAGVGVVTDPRGPDTGPARVLRGGSWRQGPNDCRSAARDKLPPDEHVKSAGFRVARSGAD